MTSLCFILLISNEMQDHSTTFFYYYARNDIFIINIAGKSVTELLAIKTSSFLARSMVK